MMAALAELGKLFIFLSRVFRTTLGTSGNLQPILAQVASISIRTLPTVIFAGVFVGAILVIQFNQILAQYDAQIFLGGLNTSTVVREVGPLIISFLLAGKIGAYTTAEIGTMRVTEQIDAIECLGTDSIQYLIVPRFVGIIFSTLILLAIGMMVSVVGAMGVAGFLYGINWLQFVSSIPKFTGLGTIFGGFFQSLVYGTIVAGVSCYQGYAASGGARGVGRAVTLAAIYTNFYIVLANFLTSQILESFSRLFHSWQFSTGGAG